MDKGDKALSFHYFLLLNNLPNTLKQYLVNLKQQELPSRSNLRHQDWHSLMLKYFDKGDDQRFYEVWEKYTHPVQNLQEYEKIEFYTHIYFTTYPVLNGYGDRWDSALQKFKEFLNTKGAELCKTNEFLQFYAIPYIQSPQHHQSFAQYFTQSWASETRERLVNFLAFVEQQVEDTQQQIPQNPKALQELEQELKKAKNREEWIRNALFESQSKWTAFSFNLLEIVKQLLLHIDGNVEANLSIIRKRVQEYEHFLTMTDDSVSNTSSLMPIVQKEQLDPLDYHLVKADIFDWKNEVKVCALLQALRWRLTRTPASIRRAVLSEYIGNDIFQSQQEGIAKLSVQSTQRIQEYTMKIINVFASECIGRSYLLEDQALIPALIQILYAEKEDTQIRENAIGILQKLSLRRKPQSIMIQLKMIQWLFNVLQNADNLGDYTLEYSAALLMNLSLRTAGKDVCEQMRAQAIPLLIDLAQHDNVQFRTYINGTLYSILTRQSIKQQANSVNLEQILHQLIQESEENLQTQLYYVLEQLRQVSEDNTTSDDETVDEDPDANIEDEDELISDEEDADVLLDEQSLIGEELLRNYRIFSQQNSDIQNQSSNSNIRSRHRVPRTPVVMQPQIKESDLSYNSKRMLDENYISKPRVNCIQSPTPQVSDSSQMVHAFKPRNKIPRTPPPIYK